MLMPQKFLLKKKKHYWGEMNRLMQKRYRQREKKGQVKITIALIFSKL